MGGIISLSWLGEGKSCSDYFLCSRLMFKLLGQGLGVSKLLI